MGMDIVTYFPDIHGSVEDFEQKNSVKLPEDIRELLSIEEAPPLDSGKSSLLEMFRRIRESIPGVNWDEPPSDGAKNYKHYLYGWPKE
jgi:hypothetical protein